MAKGRADRFQLDHIVLRLLAVGELTISLLFFLVVALTKSHSLTAPDWLVGLLSDIATALLASAAITFLLEPITRRRLEQDIEELRRAQVESILRGAMPAEILQEVQQHIIRQPFLRKNLHVAFEFAWHPTSDDFVTKTETSSFQVENVSQTMEIYHLRLFEDIETGDRFPSETNIIEVSVTDAETGTNTVYRAGELEKYTTRTSRLVEVEIPLPLTQNRVVSVTTKVQSVLPSRNVYNFVVTAPTIQLDLTVGNPRDLEIQAVPMHPSHQRFITEVDTPTLKRWRIDAGLLPYQGIELSWRTNKTASQTQP